MLFPFYLLIFEESPYEAALLRLLLKMHFSDWTYYIVTSRQELMQFLAGGSPVSLLLIDVDIPDTRRLTMVQELRQRSIYHSLPIVSICSSLVPPCASDLIDAGASACFQKSPDVNQLIGMLRNLTVFSTHHIN